MELGKVALQVGMYGLVGLCIQGSPSGDLSRLKRAFATQSKTSPSSTGVSVDSDCALMAPCQLDIFAGHVDL